MLWRGLDRSNRKKSLNRLDRFICQRINNGSIRRANDTLNNISQPTCRWQTKARARRCVVIWLTSYATSMCIRADQEHSSLICEHCLGCSTLLTFYHGKRSHALVTQCVRVRACKNPQRGLWSRGHSLNQGTWGGQILTLHLNYVAGYTSPLLFLFKWTHNYSVDNQELVPWQHKP